MTQSATAGSSLGSIFFSGHPVVTEVDDVALDPSQTTALFRYLPSHLTVDFGFSTSENSESLELELPSGLNGLSIHIPSHSDPFTFQRLQEDYFQLEGSSTTGLDVIEYDDGPRLFIPGTFLTGVDLDFTDLTTITVDNPSCCACSASSGSSDKQTGSSPRIESPTQSVSPTGVSASFSLGLDCCDSQESPGLVVWRPLDLHGSWNNLGINMIALPNRNMISSGLLDYRKSGNVRQWRTDESLVVLRSEDDNNRDDRLTITTYLNPPSRLISGPSTTLYVEPSRDNVLSETVICRLESGELEFKSSYEGEEVQHYLIKQYARFASDQQADDNIINITSIDLNSGVRSKVETLWNLFKNKFDSVTTTSQVPLNASGSVTQNTSGSVGDENGNISGEVITSKVLHSYGLQDAWFRLNQRIDAYGESYAQTTTYDLFDVNGHAAKIQYGSGGWMLRLLSHPELPASAREIRVYPFLNSPCPSGDLASIQSISLDAYRVTYWEGDDFITLTNGQQTGRMLYTSIPDYGGAEIFQRVLEYRSNSEVLFSSRHFYGFAHPQVRLRGKSIQTISNNRETMSYDYEFGVWDASLNTWTSDSNGEDLQMTVINGSNLAGDNELAQRTMRVTSYYSRQEEILCKQEAIYLGGDAYDLFSTTTYTREGPHAPYGNRSITMIKDGRVMNTTLEDSSFVTTTFDHAGTRTQTVRDTAGRMISSTRFYDNLPGKSNERTEYVYRGLTTEVIRKHGYGSDAQAPFTSLYETTSSRTVDLLGRMVSSTSETGHVMTYGYPDVYTDTESAFGSILSQTVRYFDGSTQEISGVEIDPVTNNSSLVVLQTQSRSVNADGQITTIRTHYDRGPTTETIDWSGRVISSSQPSGTGVAHELVTMTYGYDSFGQRTSMASSAPNVPAVLTKYHPLGFVTDSGQDTAGPLPVTYSPGDIVAPTDPDGFIFPGVDRMTRYDVRYIELNGAWWQQTSTQSQASADPASIITQISRNRIEFPDPSVLAETQTIAPDGGIRTSVTSIATNGDGYPQQGAVTTTATSPNSDLPAVTITVDGMIVSATSHLSSVIETWTYTEDNSGYISTYKNAKGGLTITKRNQLGQTVEVRDPVHNIMTYEYGTDPVDPTIGRLLHTTNGEDETTTCDYDILGRKISIGGDTYPIEYSYDAIGRMITMRTHRRAGSNSITSWIYNSNSGLLAQKLYDNGSPSSAKGPSYEYDAAGRLKKRKWARTLADNETLVATTYTYNTTGDLRSVSYNDGLTPDNRYGFHDLYGRPTRIHREEHGDLELQHDPYLRGVLEEEYEASHTALPSVKLVNEIGNTVEFHSLGQRIGQKLYLGTGDELFHSTFNYVASQGRPSVHRVLSQELGANQNSHVVSRGYVSYEEGTFQPKEVTTRLTDTNVRFNTKINRDSSYRINSRSDVTAGSVPISATLTSVGYQYDRANRRTVATREDGTMWNYQYNDRGEVTSASKSLQDEVALAGQQFGYAYDDIGNRTSASFGGGTGGMRQIIYTSNNLNQYVNITHSQHANILGTVDSNDSVHVVGQIANPDRQGDYFRAEVRGELSLSNGEWFETNVTVNGVTTNEGAQWIPAVFTGSIYDDDGNLTKDGRWSYTWDAENRLIRMEPTGSALRGGHPYTILEFEYDHLSRRIIKRVLNGYANPSVISDRRFLYDGWNLVAEFEVETNNILKLAAHHHWCNDISGTSQGAGGVGGLFMSRIKNSDTLLWESYYPTYDGNGNIIAWLDNSASVVQRIDYDAFGNTLTKNGDFPDGVEVNFGFSTKYEDEETGLLYYGYRYYDPVTGRWSSRDPINEVGGPNIYAFVLNTGNNGYDYLGLVLDTIFDVGSIAYDIGKLAGAVHSDYDEGIRESLIDLSVDTTAALTPFVPAGASKAKRAADALAWKKKVDRARKAKAKKYKRQRKARANPNKGEGIDDIKDAGLRSRCQRLRKLKDAACTAPRLCDKDTCCEEIGRRINRASKCLALRLQITSVCFAGKDKSGKDHSGQEEAVKRTRASCKAWYKNKCVH